MRSTLRSTNPAVRFAAATLALPLTIGLVAPVTLAQDTTGQGAATAESTSTDTGNAASAADAASTSPGGQDDITAPVRRPPLLREGSALVRVIGEMHFNEETGDWRFIIDRTDPRYGEHELRVMPSSHLREMERLRDAVDDDDDRLVMEVTGQVYVYKGWNYLLPTHPPLLISRDEAVDRLEANEMETGRGEGESDAAEQGPADAAATGVDDDDPVRAAARGDSTAEILEALERATGPVIRRPEVDDRPTTAARPNRRGADVVADARRLLAEGSMLVDRLGTLRRTDTGGWMFIFDADAEGQGDPPAVLLPSMVLERMEKYAQSQGRDVKVLLSGQVTTYRGRNFILPTMYRRPRLNTPLTP
jgi:hypothetical protein